MKWSWTIGRYSGIAVRVHWTFLLLIAWLVYVHASRGDSLAVAAEGIGFVLALFACVLLHEFGHALTARRFGIRTRDITLLPIGGVARLERIPERPLQELWVALAGPLVNVAIAVVLLIVILIAGSMGSVEDLTHIGGHFITKLMWLNVLLVVFNMIPAFPMDGGRVLRALLATKLDYVRATQIAATIGQFIAICFGLLGLLYNPFLLFIALFVYLGAGQEAHAVSIRSVTRGVPVRSAMMRHFQVLSPSDTIQTAIDELLAGSQHDFPVVEDGRVLGILTRDSIVRALNESGPRDRVDQHMTRECISVDETEMLEEVLPRMRDTACSSLAVLREGQLVGLLTMENIGELMMISSALHRPRSTRTASAAAPPPGP